MVAEMGEVMCDGRWGHSSLIEEVTAVLGFPELKSAFFVRFFDFLKMVFKWSQLFN